MELMSSEIQTKALLKEVILELMTDNRELFLEIIMEAMEEIGLANAIIEGRKNEFVDKKEIFALLEGGK